MIKERCRILLVRAGGCADFSSDISGLKSILMLQSSGVKSARVSRELARGAGSRDQ